MSTRTDWYAGASTITLPECGESQACDSGADEVPSVDRFQLLADAGRILSSSLNYSPGVTALGLLVLAGCAFDVSALNRTHPSFDDMEANAAFLFVLLGISLWSARRNGLFLIRRARDAAANVRLEQIELTANRVEGQSPPLFTGFIRDISKRKRSAEQFRLAIEAAPTGMIMVDPAGKIVLVNAQIEHLFGFRRNELIGQTVEVLVPERFRAHHPVFRKGFVSEPRYRAMGAGRDLYGLRQDGVEFPIEIGLNPIRTAEGIFVLSSVVDISERKRAEREREALLDQLQSLNAELEERVRHRTSELLASLKEREILLQEVHHRVKNNLQVISSLINMQMRQLDEPRGREALEECQSRVQAIALIHEKLYHAREYARVPFSEYARSLAGNIFHTSGTSPDRIALQLEIENVSVGVDRAIPCGLILNELITNALKHAFPAEQSGVVHVQLRRMHPDRLLLVVCDNGIGMTTGLYPGTPGSLGMQLVATLVEQLDGQLEIVRNHGTAFRIEFPAEVV